MSSTRNITEPLKASGLTRPILSASATSLATLFISFGSLVGFTTTEANACACGCSVFDVSGLDMMPQEQESGGRVFFEYWSQDQKQNYVGSSKAPAFLNKDKDLNTQWYNVGLSYNFNRDWGIMIRVPMTANRSLTTETDFLFPGQIQTFNSKSFGDLEIMGVYTGFFPDMSTGLIFGLKLPTGTYTALGMDRDNQIGTGSTDLILGAFHRGLLSGDNAWQYFSQFVWRQPFAYKSADDPQGFFDGNLGVLQTYHPGMQIDGAIGIVYNNWYNVLGFDKITPLAQVIVSHRDSDSGTGADPLNSGFDRVMISPGIEFTKVLDEANNYVLKTYVDVEIPVYYRATAANNAGTEGQLVAPYLLKVTSSFNFAPPTPARAADLPAKVYSKAPAAPAAIYDWSGFFVGFNAGGGSNNNCWTNSLAGGAPTVPSVSEGCIDTTGALLGGQIGHRWQASNWVLGVEAQGDWANLAGSTASLFLTAPQVTNQSKINALGLFTGQVGYAFNNILWFLKGGAAVTSNKYNGIDTASGTVLDQATETRWGGTVGTGAEIGFATNWSVGAEFNYLFMGTKTVNFNAVPAGGLSRTDSIQENVFSGLLRVNYRFGGPVAAGY